VKQVKINDFNLESLEGGFAGANGAADGGVGGENFADELNAIFKGCDCLADQRLRAAAAVHFGGVDEGHAEFDPVAKGGDLGRAV
jgi:hypothetical protein